MSYQDFTLAQLTKDFGLVLEEKPDLFGDIPGIELDEFFLKVLKRNIPLAEAINTEKAKSEMIVAPMLLELKTILADRISLFSGILFNVDSARGLNGFCDFIVSLSSQQFYLNSPAIAIVEAKNDNIVNGLPQCIAEMLAAQIFNSREENSIETIYGVVTNGTQWKFLTLCKNIVSIDSRDYYMIQPQKILGILASVVTKEE